MEQLISFLVALAVGVIIALLGYFLNLNTMKKGKEERENEQLRETTRSVLAEAEANLNIASIAKESLAQKRIMLPFLHEAWGYQKGKVYALPENVKKVFVQHEIGYIRNALLLKEMKSDQMIDKYHFEKLKSFEVSTMNQYNVIITLTDVDSMKLKNDNVITAIMSSPACIPVKTKHSNYTYTTNRLTFLGGYNHKPNSDGLKWFLEKVWSFILITKPDTVLDVVGSWPKDVCEELMKRYKNITFKGMIQDLATVLPGSVMIVPILVGSGMRMKILDAVNHGCPFVTTTVGVEGLNFVNNESCFVEDVSESFASKVLELLNNKELQELFLLNSQKVYNENYSIEILGDKRLQIYNDLYSQKIHSNNTGME